MNNRIREVRKFEGLTQAEFSSRLGLSRNYIGLIEIGERVPSDRTISDICRVFGVNETWLRTGEGEMFTGVKQEMFDFVSSSIGELTDTQTKLLSTMARLPVEKWKVLNDIANEMAKAAENEKKW